jgi:hypothetical protein
VGGGIPTPRKDSAASSRIATEDRTTTWTRIGLSEFGSTVVNIV